MGRILAWILRMSNDFGIIEMAWLPKKLKEYWYRCNLHQWHFTANGLVHVQQIRAVSLKKNYQCLCQNGKVSLAGRIYCRPSST